ncbi:TPA: histidine--tRNA ligase [Candidatus Woesearchaeota archaeon]|nr:histidine--tRNA ligase [Candidatus Woesearchaeota archaeon]
MELQTAKGVRDTPPEEKIVKDKVIQTLTRVFELYGFAPLETPILERYETLAAKSGAGEESDALKETFKLTDQGERKLGLRFELTTSLARYVAMNPTIKMPFKRYEVGQVFRDGPIKLGRYRQFWQCDVDTIGTGSMLADTEFIVLALRVFEELGLNVVVKVNNRKILNGLLEQAGILGIENQKKALIAVDKLDKIGRDGVEQELLTGGFTLQQSTPILDFVSSTIDPDALQNSMTSTEGKEGLAELKELFEYLTALKLMGLKSKVLFDRTLVRGQAYYTGTVMEVYLSDGSFPSSLAGGGRYDTMIGGFMGGGREIPAVGLSFGLEPIMDILRRKEKLVAKTPARVFVLPINTVAASLQFVQELRDSDIPADISLGKKGVSKNLEYANALGIPLVVIIGDDELKKGEILLRDMTSGLEERLPRGTAIKKIRTLITQ